MNEIIKGDALTILKTLPSESVNCVMTSPPYWALRDYGVDGQLGLESTFNDYIIKLCDIFDEVKRVLRKDGTCWINIGDTYSGIKTGKTDGKYSEFMKHQQRKIHKKSNGYQEKSLCLIPMRFTIEMVNRGWILRNDIVWYKRNSMPTSIKDRFGNKWEHLLFFVKSKRYYFDLDSVRKPHKTASLNPIQAGFSKSCAFNYRVREAAKGTLEPKFGSRFKASIEEMQKWQKNELSIHGENAYNSLGGNPGDHWDITTKGHPFAHFAVYPEELCEIPIKAGCPKDGIVLDPFIGSGTTALVSLKQNKNFIGIELNEDYIKIAKKRLKPFLEQTKLAIEVTA